MPHEDLTQFVVGFKYFSWAFISFTTNLPAVGKEDGRGMPEPKESKKSCGLLQNEPELDPFSTVLEKFAMICDRASRENDESSPIAPKEKSRNDCKSERNENKKVAK
jgi:hypothetical protein